MESVIIFKIDTQDKAALLKECKRNRISLSGYIRQKLFSEELVLNEI